MKRFILAILLGIGFGNGGLCGTIDPQVPDHKYQEYGAKFTYVGQLCGLDKEGKISIGSCVAIKPKVVLTAAHVISDLVISHIHINGKEINVLKMVKCPEYAGGFGRGDIAICFLDTDMELSFYPELYVTGDETGKLACMAGYGMTGTFFTGAVKSDGKKRAGSNYIDNIVEDVLVVTPSVVNNKTSLEYMIAPGDSGGGLFIDNKLAGINSCVMHTKPKNSDLPAILGKYGHEGCHTRVSVHAPWIKEVVALHESGFHGKAFLADTKVEEQPKRCVIAADATTQAQLESADR
jgi:hypothetical protein